MWKKNNQLSVLDFLCAVSAVTKTLFLSCQVMCFFLHFHFSFHGCNLNNYITCPGNSETLLMYLTFTVSIHFALSCVKPTKKNKRPSSSLYIFVFRLHFQKFCFPNGMQKLDLQALLGINVHLNRYTRGEIKLDNHLKPWRYI